MPGPSVLKLSIDGVLQPLGRSQIVKPILGLADRGLSIRLVTAERERDIRDPERVRQLQSMLRAAGVRWSYVTYQDGGGPARLARTLAGMTRLALRDPPSEPTLVWARSFLCGTVALTLRLGRGWPFVYDTRGYWVENRLRVAGRAEPLWRGVMHIERRLYQECAAAVSLTELACEDVRRGRYGDWPTDRPILCIPTCADFDEFFLDRPRTTGPPGRVLGFVGSLNTDYHVKPALFLARRIQDLDPRAHLVCVTQQTQAMQEALRGLQFPFERCSVRSVEHGAMPSVLREIDWGLMLLHSSDSKRASMPTKLAEFFASGVAPIQYGCNPEVSDWVERTGSGLVLSDLEPKTLDRAAQMVATTQLEPEALSRSRDRARAHFGLERGIEDYATLFERIGSS